MNMSQLPLHVHLAMQCVCSTKQGVTLLDRLDNNDCKILPATLAWAYQQGKFILS